jgi:hypothetical protein
MPLYKLLYLPTKDQIFTDGCKVIDLNGEVSEWKEYHNAKDFLRVAHPMLVTFEYNRMVLVGRPTEAALKWLKVGDEVKAVDCSIIGQRETNEDCDYVISVKCPHCGEVH